jgi:hypothetical protein
MDVYPGVKSWSFQGSHYSSPYFSFAALDAGSAYPSVLPQPERRLLSTYDKPPYAPGQDRGAIPFIDIADRYVQAGSSASVAVLASAFRGFTPSELGGSTKVTVL